MSDDLATAFGRIFATTPIDRLISNLQTTVSVRRAGPRSIPVTANAVAQSPTCYICCPSVAYVGYAREELRHFKDYRALIPVLNLVLRLGYPLVQAARLDHQVQPNNWLLATNPVPPVTAAELRDLTNELIAEWPDRTILWRSLNDVSDSDTICTFASAGYEMLAARQIYLFDCRNGLPKTGRDERRDLDLLNAGEFEIVPHQKVTRADFQRAEALYRHLYLEKYTWLNPQYTALFLEKMYDNGILDFSGLRSKDGELAGIIGYFDRGDTMTAPVVGYNTSLPQARGLYRMLMALAIGRARDRGMLFNMSAGAAGFKRNRGALPALEYSALYNRHLPARTRVAGSIVRHLLAKIGAPLLRTLEL